MLLPHPAPRCRASMRPYVEAPLGESTVLPAVAGAGAHESCWSSCAVGLEGLGRLRVRE